jgi:hypothetical protein
MTMTNPSAGPFDFESIQGIRDEFDKLKATDCFVAGALRTGLPESDALKLCVVVTSQQNSDLKQALADALLIAPQRYKLPDGRTMRWDAPDHLVPQHRLDYPDW